MPLLAVRVLRPEYRPLPEAASISGLVAYPVVLAAAILIYVHWRVGGGATVAWLTIALTTTSVQGASLSLYMVEDAELVRSKASWLLLVQIGVTALILVVARVSERRAPRRDPFSIGLALGTGVAVVSYGVMLAAPPLAASTWLVAGLGLVLIGLTLTISWVVLRLDTLPMWVRARLALAVVLLCVSLAALDLPGEYFLAAAIALGAAMAGSVILCGMALRLLRGSLRDNKRALAHLNDRLVRFEADSRHDRARLHEIGSTVAGLASASRLIQDQQRVPTQRRELLQDMMQSEVQRLERLMSDRGPDPRQQVDLDEIIGRLVVGQAARGHAITWTPSGHRVWSRHDDLTEILHILLDNAAHHGRGTGTAVRLRSAEAHLEISVSDAGPGIGPDLADRVFDWGVRRTRSRGQGIGLHIAWKLAAELGGELRLDLTSTPGATFVLRLPHS